MLTEKVFAVAHLADQVILWILLILSVLSIGMILERFFALRKMSAESKRVRDRIKSGAHRAIAHCMHVDIETIAIELGDKFAQQGVIDRRAAVTGLWEPVSK